jgi:type VII secretion-associated protein (TIGR03931 family)
VTDVIVEVGPAVVRGPGAVDAESASAALECIDDDIALVADRPVAVRQLWRDVLSSAVGGFAETVVLVCPTWWAASRVDRVCDGARSSSANVVALQRFQVLGAGLPARTSTAVEIAPAFVVISRAGADTVVVARLDSPDEVARAVAAAIGTPTAVLVDAPVGVAGARPLGAAIAGRLRVNGIAVTVADHDLVLHAAAELRAGEHDQPADAECVGGSPAIRLGRRAVVALAGAVLSLVVLCAAFAARPGIGVTAVDDVPMTLLVEGRVGVKVPALWTVQRITSGPGSARVQIVSPADPHTALHITQSPMPPQTQAMAAETLRKALDEQPGDVFVDFKPADRKAGKDVISYRELRPGHHIQWAVLIDEGVRIAIGCQSPPGRDQPVRYACEHAIRSAHAVF